uniref:D-arabinono-1,4-lactone oxidase C-terminal domain-containing protein n=1 Tax=Zooxanthella nutricula TaxID=1333877 RepID=A0A7S2K041_9DINO|mmetsp:Transcript_39775/g.120133  ORF Transcript_39775/g.120133 Transcript_39775/m.120133 type:complete len:145 (+) Transcript_39775:1-435(+)
MDRLRDVQLASRGSKRFQWNLPGEFRFIKVSDQAVLQPIGAGLWFNAQMISMEALARDEQQWKQEFMKIEKYWVNDLGAKPHMGKLWGFHRTETGEVEAFSEKFACTIYSAETKAKFDGYRRQQDPEGLFFSGLGPKLLAPCSQ